MGKITNGGVGRGRCGGRGGMLDHGVRGFGAGGGVLLGLELRTVGRKVSEF
ncbi:hypothetical protein DPMN_054779 [Dreissena polymorpha]|uniref:Uncharacterized protein n=1 Tax=Dreissena polymorpha TaxID=45954 RepID=A0A9D4HQ28_DREPO|nr:hypothetical protein DPMN_054779 [Dreissena polymorpha]